MTTLSKAEARHLFSLLKRLEKDLSDLVELRRLLDTKKIVADQAVDTLPAGLVEKIRRGEDVEYPR